jgi:hypothetical protein
MACTTIRYPCHAPRAARFALVVRRSLGVARSCVAGCRSKSGASNRLARSYRSDGFFSHAVVPCVPGRGSSAGPLLTRQFLPRSTDGSQTQEPSCLESMPGRPGTAARPATDPGALGQRITSALSARTPLAKFSGPTSAAKAISRHRQKSATSASPDRTLVARPLSTKSTHLIGERQFEVQHRSVKAWPTCVPGQGHR